MSEALANAGALFLCCLSPLARHSGAGRNPVATTVGYCDALEQWLVAPAKIVPYSPLDSGLRRNDEKEGEGCLYALYSRGE
ncbi:hypothetical protein [Dyella japonica]|uniref:hypothetical protein n=1 Tax=Dyella japonica TaxID=231455 RepID=UPI001184D419|nr:hypothetical protein [Dyella japonica]